MASDPSLAIVYVDPEPWEGVEHFVATAYFDKFDSALWEGVEHNWVKKESTENKTTTETKALVIGGPLLQVFHN